MPGNRVKQRAIGDALSDTLGKRPVQFGRSFLSKKLLWVFIALFLAVWANNSSLFVDRSEIRPILLAHRGLAQTFDLTGVVWDTNTARIIHEPEHPYIENTIPSMQAAFAAGADLVEFDVRLTKDKQLAVFHDYTLEFRTDGTGNLSDLTLAELKKLDVGYGYTADGGKSFPLRGTGVGMMPSLDDVLTAFPDKAFLIHFKDGGEESGRLLDDRLQKMDPDRLANISVYGNQAAVLTIKSRYPTMKVLTKRLMISAFVWYELVGWTGYVPKAIRNLEIHMPLNYARLLWGWPDRFLQRMDAVNTRFVLVNGDGEFSDGFDTAVALEKLPKGYSGTIWTDRIDKISPLLHRES